MFAGRRADAARRTRQEVAFQPCSAKFGRLRQAAALLAFQTGCDEVADAAWCPSNATVFAAATAGGRLEVRPLRVARHML